MVLKRRTFLNFVVYTLEGFRAILLANSCNCSYAVAGSQLCSKKDKTLLNVKSVLNLVYQISH